MTAVSAVRGGVYRGGVYRGAYVRRGLGVDLGAAAGTSGEADGPRYLVQPSTGAESPFSIWAAISSHDFLSTSNAARVRGSVASAAIRAHCFALRWYHWVSDMDGLCLKTAQVSVQNRPSPLSELTGGALGRRRGLHLTSAK
jgi:hypothetical protein